MPDQQRGLERGCGVCICPRSLNGPTPELILRSVQPFQAVNGIGEVAPPLSLSFLPRTTLNKDTGLSGRGRHTVVVRRAQQLAIAQYLPGSSAVGSLWVDRASPGWLACLLSSMMWHARTMCCRRGAGFLVARRHSMRGWACSPDPASCRCRTFAQATRQEDL